jgi:L-aspartate oxidase
VAGLSVALGLEACAVITKTRLGAGSSDWAQGGVASALAADDSPALHAEDTVKVSAGLAVEEAVARLTERGPEAIERLVALGAEFDRDDEGALALGREAGHSRRRIVHANGDATGAEVMRTLVAAIDDRPRLQVFEDHLVVDLIVGSDGSVRGVLVVTSAGEAEVWIAPAVVIATGGVGQVFARTTNPAVVTGDGIAMAVRAGVRVADMEFVQFHPTALDAGLDPMPLLTEALRGEGAHLVDRDGHRYLVGIHPDAELAPRDVVARANYRNRGNAYLDATIIGETFPERFPTVFASAMAVGIDPRRSPMPVSAACHYFMGGIAAGPRGHTSALGLYAVGEASSTGIHGANRLASNSLLEGLVFGRMVAEAIRSDGLEPSGHGLQIPSGAPDSWARRGPGIGELRAVMWGSVGVERSQESLDAAAQGLADLEDQLVASVEGRNLHTVATQITTAALERRESRGSHYRIDYPEIDATRARRQEWTLLPELEPLAAAVR